MASDSKILTVSYGTFSCTLEGFDDPFNTMKAIAEYFRDLAAEDRYFGAEPPQPDAAMLHRIAEREVGRLADRRARDGSLVLRADEDGASGAVRRVTTRPRPAGDLAEVAERARPNPDAQAGEPTLQALIPSGVASKLARIRQAVNPSVLAPHAFAPRAEAPLPEAPAPALDIPASRAPAAAVSYAPLSDDADVLSRIGALVSDRVPADPVEALAEPIEQHVEPPIEESADAAPMVEIDDPETAEAQIEAEVENWLSRTAQAEEAAAPAPLPAEVADLLPEAAPEAPLSLTEALAQDPLPEATLQPEAPVADHPTAAKDEAEPLSLIEALAQDPLPEATPEGTAIASEAPVADLPPAVEAAPAEAAEPAPKSKTKRVNSRVVRIHPDDDAPAGRDPNTTRVLDKGGDEDFARLLRQADDVMSDSENLRRLESIAQLKAAVAATEADRAAGVDPKSAPGAKEHRYRDDLAQTARPEPAPKPEPPIKPRRKTISVRPQERRPGTIRPGMVSPPPLVLVSEQRIDRIVPPAAPAAQPAPAPAAQPKVALRTGRLTGAIGVGAAAATTVLPAQKLVLEQRSGTIDAEEDDDLVDDLSEADAAGLARFAEQVGVKSMVDMLEAAAAYATCIENRSQFTRPQLMRRLTASAGGKNVSREEGLRSFGTLLRTGRIEKVGRGHYVLAEHSPYLAEARRMA